MSAYAMITRLYSAALRGVDAAEVEVEVNSSDADKPLILIVGLPDAAVRESSQRVTSAIYASALRLEDGIKTVNLAPADLRKEGPSFDLPIALAMVAASRNRPFEADDCCIVGELGLDGAVRPVKGVLSIACEAKRCGRTRLLVPAANAAEAAAIDGIQVFAIRNLREAWDFLNNDLIIPPTTYNQRTFTQARYEHDIDFAEVKGQHLVKRALEVAAAGSHALLKLGPPSATKVRLFPQGKSSHRPPLHALLKLPDQRVRLVAIILFGMVQGVMQTSRLLAAQGAFNNQTRHRD